MTSRWLLGCVAAGALASVAGCAASDDQAADGPLPTAVTTVRTADDDPPPNTEPPDAPQTSAAPEPLRDFSKVGSTLRSLVDANGLNGAGLVVVERENGIVHEEYVGEFDADRVSLIASSSKMITAGVLLHLADKGLLDLDAPVADAVDWGAGNPDVTPAQLVSNSSGLVGLNPIPIYGPYLCQFLPNRELEECAAEIFQTAGDDDDVIPPDTEFRYGGAQWQVAGAVAEAVSGQTWSELIEEIYVEPCGVTSLGYNNHWSEAGGFDYPSDLDPADLPPTENPQMEGGAYITPPDYAALLLMHLRGGVCDGGRVLSEKSVARAHTDRVAAAYGENGGDHPGYGMGWWVDRTTGVISDGGAYGSLPWLDVEDGYGAYLVIEADSGLGARMFGQLAPLVESIMT